MANPNSSPGAGAFWVYVGNYGETAPKGIFLQRFDSATGALTSLGTAASAEAPNFVIVHPNGKYLYAVTMAKMADYKGTVEGFAIDGRTGKLTPINRQPCGGDNPCHLAIDPTGKLLIVANYSGGTIAAFPLAASGEIAPATAVIQHKGSSVNPKRQNKPYAHGVTFDATGRVILVCDLGVDKVFNYQVDAGAGTLTPCAPPGDFATVAAGSGPRHVVLGSGGKFMYVLNEMSTTITAFGYQSPGIAREIQTLAPWPKDARASGAEIEVHPNGRFIYASNRGPDSIAVCAIDPATGQLNLIGLQASGGKTPRHFAFDPSGKFMLVSNQDSDRVDVFRVDPESGKLAATGVSAPAAACCCVAFVPVAA